MSDITTLREAAVAHTDLNVFAAVQIMLESSLQSSLCEADARKIIKIAKEAQQKCLRRYDTAIASLRKGPSND